MTSNIEVFRQWQSVTRWTGSARSGGRGDYAQEYPGQATGYHDSRVAWLNIDVKSIFVSEYTILWSGTADGNGSWERHVDWYDGDEHIGSQNGGSGESKTLRVEIQAWFDLRSESIIWKFDQEDEIAEGILISKNYKQDPVEIIEELNAAGKLWRYPVSFSSPNPDIRVWPVVGTDSRNSPGGEYKLEYNLLGETRSEAIKLMVIENATQSNVIGAKNWAATKEDSKFVVVEATTFPDNSIAEWQQIEWSGDISEIVDNKLNRRRVSCNGSKKFHLEAKFNGETDYVDIWIIWATIKILTRGVRPPHAAPFDPGAQDNTEKLGAVRYETLFEAPIDEENGVFVRIMGASGKVVPVATLLPQGVSQIVKSGWAFKREVMAHEWRDRIKVAGNKVWTETWVDDTSNSNYQRLIPDDRDKIYDLDAPGSHRGEKNFETYNNFRQWIEWNNEKCSDYELWFWRARWRLHKEPMKQIVLAKVGAGNIELPNRSYFRSDNLP